MDKLKNFWKVFRMPKNFQAESTTLRGQNPSISLIENNGAFNVYEIRYAVPSGFPISALDFTILMSGQGNAPLCAGVDLSQSWFANNASVNTDCSPSGQGNNLRFQLERADGSEVYGIGRVARITIDGGAIGIVDNVDDF